MSKIELTISELEVMLNEQKMIVIKKLAGQSGYYNKKTDSGNYRTLSIDNGKFEELGMKACYPDDFNVLKRYIKSV